MNENKCLGYPLSVAGHTIKVNGCRNMAQLLEQDARISALETENAALRGRLEFTSCQKADVEAQVLALEEQNAALRQDAAVGRAITLAPKAFKLELYDGKWYVTLFRDLLVCHFVGDTLYAALAAAGLVEEGNRA